MAWTGAPYWEGTAALALVEEASRKTGTLWVAASADARPVAVWHVWHDGAVCVVGGPGEQALPPLVPGSLAVVTVPSKDTGGRLVTWRARVVRLTPADERWDATVAALAAARLHLPDAGGVSDRWAATALVARLQPTGELLESPGSMDAGSHAAPPPPTAATTRGRLPFVLGRRRGPAPADRPPT